MMSSWLRLERYRIGSAGFGRVMRGRATAGLRAEEWIYSVAQTTLLLCGSVT